MRLVPRSLRARVTLVFSLGTAAVLLLSLGLLYLALDQEFAVALDSDLAARADDLSAAVDAGDPGVIAQDPLAQLYTPTGAVAFGSPALADHRLLTAAQVGEADGATVRTMAMPDDQDGGSMRIRVLAQRLEDGRVLAVGVSTEPLDHVRQRLLQVLLVAAPLLLGALALGGWLVVRAALRPVDVLTREAAAISSFEPDRALPVVPGEDEIARLAATLADMLTRLRIAFERERAFVDDASHELRTPIAVLRGEIELALSARDDPDEVERALRSALGEAERLTRLAEDLLLLARERAGSLVMRREPVDLLDLALTEGDRLERALGLRIRVGGDPAVVPGDPERLRQLFTNLAANSATAGSTLVRAAVTADRAVAMLEFADDGPGFPEDILDSALERFVRSEASRTGPGAGLGLSIARAIVVAHGGTVDIGNGGPLGGAVVTVHLPLH